MFFNTFQSISSQSRSFSTQHFKLNLKSGDLSQNSRGPTNFFLIMKCSNYEFALNIKCQHNGLRRDHNHLSESTLYLEIIILLILLYANVITTIY